MTATKCQRGRMDHVDGLRALAALYVVLHHCVLYVNNDLPGGLLKRIVGVFLFGHFAVDVFIVISGYCLMLPVIKNHEKIAGGPMGFFLKRGRRILPPYFAVLAISLFLIWRWIGVPTGSMWDNSLPVTGSGVITHLLLIQDFLSSTSHQINYCLWSISVEWRIYFLFPVLVYCWSRFGPLKMAAATTFTSLILLVPLSYTFLDGSAGGLSLHYYGLFTFGMLAAGFSHSANPRLAHLKGRLPWAVLFGATGLLTAIFNKGYIADFRLPWQCQDLFVGAGTLCLLVMTAPRSTAHRWDWLRNFLGSAPLVFVSAFSYSLYLIHAPLLQVAWVYLVAPMHLPSMESLVVLSTVGVLLVLVCAYVFYLLFERPFMSSYSKIAKPTLGMQGEASMAPSPVTASALAATTVEDFIDEEVEATPQVSAIVISYNTRAMTLECLEHLQKALEEIESEIIVVDNASLDDSVAAIESAFPAVQIIRRDSNSGFGASNNVAMRVARGKYLLLLNTDAFPETTAISNLIEFIEQYPNAAAVGPRLLNADGSLQVSCHPFPTPAFAWGENLWLARGYRDWRHDSIRSVDFLIGACMLVRREVYEQVGGFDERFFMYSEEADWQRRMKQAGWEVLFTPAARVTHLGGASGAGEAERISHHFFESLDYYERKHHGLAGLVAFRAAMTVGCALRALLWSAVSLLPGRRPVALAKVRKHSRLCLRQAFHWN